MDKLESLRAFVAVARAGGFSAASRALGTPLATVSRKVAELEDSLGVRLLQRSTRQVVLTESGDAYYQACLRLLDDLKEADDAVTGEYRTPRGELSITAPVGFGRQHLQPVATEFLRAFPDIDLRLMLVDRVVNLVEEHLDLALRISELPDSGLVARPLGAIRMVVCATPSYLAIHGVPQHPDELTRHHCIAWSSLGPYKSWTFTDGGRERAFPIRVRLTTTTPESAIAAALDDVGLVQAVSYQAADAVRAGRLVPLLRDFEAATTPVSLVYPGSRRVPLKLRAFLDFATPRLTARLADVAAIFQVRQAPARVAKLGNSPRRKGRVA